MNTTYLTYPEVAQELSLSLSRVMMLVSEGKLHSVKSRAIGRKGSTKYISREDLDRYKQRKVNGITRHVAAVQPTVPNSQAQSTELIQVVHGKFMEFFDAAMRAVTAVAITGIQDYRDVIKTLLAHPALHLSSEEQATAGQELAQRLSEGLQEVERHGYTPEAMAEVATRQISGSNALRQKLGDVFSSIQNEATQQPVDAQAVQF